MGKSGAVRVKAKDAAYGAAMQDHEERLDFAGTRRSIRDVRPFVYSPYARLEALDPFVETAKQREADKDVRLKQIDAIIEEKPENRNFSIMDALEAHVRGANKHGAARKDLLHGFMQFPTDMKVTERNQRKMLAIAVDFVNQNYGGNAVFHGRIDRDERGQHGVDIFFAPRYLKYTKSKGEEQWISLSKFSKDNARERLGKRKKKVRNKKTKRFEIKLDDNGKPVMIWNDGRVFQGQALQDAWYEHLKEHIGWKYEVERGKRKQGSDPDRQSPEDYAFEQERQKLRAEVERQLDGGERAPEEDVSHVDAAAKLIKQSGERAHLKAQVASEHVLQAAEEDAEAIRDRAIAYARTDADAITHAMLSADAAEFAALRKENASLQHEVLRLGRIVELISKVLKAALPQKLRQVVEQAFNAECSKVAGLNELDEFEVGGEALKTDQVNDPG